MPIDAVIAAGDPAHVAHHVALAAGLNVHGFDVTESTYGVVNDNGAADQSAKVQAALDAAEAAGGGTVLLPPWLIQAQNLAVGTRVRLVGHGLRTRLRPAANATLPVITTKDGASEWFIGHLAVSGGRDSSSPTGTAHGIHIKSSTQAVTPAGGQDAFGRIDHVHVAFCGGTGILLDSNINVRETFLSNFYIRRCQVGLDVVSTDNRIGPGSIAGSYGNGVQVRQADNTLIGVKSFFSGYGTNSFTTSASGFVLSGSGLRNNIVGCVSQDNALYGFDVQTDENMLHGLAMGGENQLGNDNGGGIRIAGSRNTVRGVWKSADLQNNGSPVVISGAASTVNDVEVQAVDTLAGALNVQLLNGASGLSNRISINGNAARTVQLAAGTTSLALRGGQFLTAPMTAGLTLSTSPNAVAGDEARLTFVQDATGGRAVTFPASFRLRSGFTVDTAANAVTVLRVTYDGTNWYGG